MTASFAVPSKDQNWFFSGTFFLMANIDQVSSYLSELKGIFKVTKHIVFLNWVPTSLYQWRDNKAAVQDITNYPETNRHDENRY